MIKKYDTKSEAKSDLYFLPFAVINLFVLSGLLFDFVFINNPVPVEHMQAHNYTAGGALALVALVCFGLAIYLMLFLCDAARALFSLKK